MVAPLTQGRGFSLSDGFGERALQQQAPHGQVEVLQLAPELAAGESAIRARASRVADIDLAVFAAVRRVERDASGVRVISDAVDGIRLSGFLKHLESSGDILSDAAALELAGSVVRAVAGLHRLPGGLAHGALTPAHILIGAEGNVILTDGVYASALEMLQWNRERLWREFRLALPASASLPRFDQRADVAQMGAIVLAIAMRRPLRADEYPGAALDLVVSATADVNAPGASGLRLWLQQALQLYPRATFASAVEAERDFADVTAVPGLRRAGAKALGLLLQPSRLLIA